MAEQTTPPPGRKLTKREAFAVNVACVALIAAASIGAGVVALVATRPWLGGWSTLVDACVTFGLYGLAGWKIDTVTTRVRGYLERRTP